MAVVSQVGEPIATGDADTLGLRPFAAPFTDFAQPVDRAAAAATEIRTLPAVPNSTILCLWALGSLGAWQSARSSRKIHFSALPEWYHAGAPQQIGHVTLFDLEFGDMPAATFDRPVCRLQYSSISSRDRERWLPPRERHVPTRDPRGPPSSR